MYNLENINKKLISYFGTPFSEKKHLRNLTFSALSIAIYGSNNLEGSQKEHILWLSEYCVEKFYKKDFDIEDIKFLHKNIIPPNKKSLFVKDSKKPEIKTIKRGEFRKINTYLNLKGHFVYFVDFRKIENELNEMISDFSSSDKNIKDISKILLEGFRIHPFMDGNGKTFRVLFDLLLIKNNYYPSLFNLTYQKNENFFEIIFTNYHMVDKAKAFEEFLESLEDVYKVAYFN